MGVSGLQKGDIPVHRLSDEDFRDEDDSDGTQLIGVAVHGLSRQGSELSVASMITPRHSLRSRMKSWRFAALCCFGIVFLTAAICALISSGPKAIAMRYSMPFTDWSADRAVEAPEVGLQKHISGKAASVARGPSIGAPSSTGVHAPGSIDKKSITLASSPVRTGNDFKRNGHQNLSQDVSMSPLLPKRQRGKQLSLDGLPDSSSVSTGVRRDDQGFGSNSMLEKPKPPEKISTGGMLEKQPAEPAEATSTQISTGGNEYGKGKQSEFWLNCKAAEGMQCFTRKGRMYAVSSTKATWMAAESRCQELAPGAHLVTIENEKENLYVASKIKQKVGFWIGLRYDGENWRWTSGAPLTFEKWYKDGKRPQRCGYQNDVTQDMQPALQTHKDFNCLICIRLAEVAYSCSRGQEMEGDLGVQHCASSNYRASKTYRHHTPELGIWDNEYCSDVVSERSKFFVCSKHIDS